MEPQTLSLSPAITIALWVIAVALVGRCVLMYLSHKRLGVFYRRFAAQDDPVQRLRARTAANLKLRAEEERTSLNDFILSEYALRQHLSTVEESDDLKIYISMLVKESEKKAAWYKKAWDWVKSNKGVIGEKLFDKL